MSAPENRSWDAMVEKLRKAAADVRSAVGRGESPSADDDAASARLKGDVSRLEQSASELVVKLSAGLRERRSEIETSFDGGRAQRSAEQMKTSIEELATMAGNVAADVAAATGNTLKQSEPELRSVARALEDVAGSTATWIRSALDPTKEQPRKQASQDRPPLDDL